MFLYYIPQNSVLLFYYFELKINILNQMLIAEVLTFGMQSNNYIESYLYHVRVFEK